MKRAQSFGYKLAGRVKAYSDFSRRNAETAIFSMASTYTGKTSLTFYQVAVRSLDEALTPEIVQQPGGVVIT